MSQNHGLGRGLASLIPQKKPDSRPDKKMNQPSDSFNYFGGKAASNLLTDEPIDTIQEIEVVRIVPNPHQPRLQFNENKLQELADSIKEHGIIQPIVVCNIGGQYEIIAGERRLQAAKIAGLQRVPVIVRKVDEQEKLELAIVENIQRHDLNPIEEAKAFYKLIEEFGLGQEEVAHKLGMSRSSIANKLRLLNLPVEIQRALVEGRITEGHAKAILAVTNPEKQRILFEMIIKENLTVRQTEEKTKEISVKSHKRLASSDPEMKEIEDRLIGRLGTKVKVTRSGKGGRIIIEYYSQEELDNLLSHIS